MEGLFRRVMTAGFLLAGFVIALFWALVVVSPLVLLVGLVAGMIGQGTQLSLIGLVTFSIFLTFWTIHLHAAGQTNAN